MARGHAFWVIVTGATATAFRAREREDLLPTLHQLQRTQPDAVVRWFDRGKLWASPIEAREALRAGRGLPKAKAQGRSRDWRPGGAHVDPKAKYKRTRDEKREQFKKRMIRGRRRAEGEAESGTVPSRPRRPRPYQKFDRSRASSSRKPRRK